MSDIFTERARLYQEHFSLSSEYHVLERNMYKVVDTPVIRNEHLIERHPYL